MILSRLQAPPQKRPKQAAPGEPEEEEEEETPEEKAAELRWRPRRAATRAYIELARLELKVNVVIGIEDGIEVCDDAMSLRQDAVLQG